MTVVAAFRLNGIPFLIGDFLITRGGAPIAARKKIQRLRSNLVVGWSGHELAAILVTSHLDRELGNTSATRATLESALASFLVADLGSMRVQLVGWLAEDLDLSFLWRSDWATEVFWSPEQYIGSGAAVFRELADTVSYGSEDFGSADDHDKNAIHAINRTARMLAREIGPGKNIAEGFGFAYEALYWEHGAFQYVNDITYGFAELHFTSQRRLQSKRVSTTVYQYQVWGECAMVDRISHRVAPHGHMRDVERHMITPLVGDTAAEETRMLRLHGVPPVKPLFEKARFHCLILTLIHASETSTPVVLPAFVAVGTDSAAAPRIEIAYGQNSVAKWTLPSDDLIRIVYNDAMKDRFPLPPPNEQL